MTAEPGFGMICDPVHAAPGTPGDIALCLSTASLSHRAPTDRSPLLIEMDERL
jgi:L-aminopeptidase/D-esterase-like protein